MRSADQGSSNEKKLPLPLLLDPIRSALEEEEEVEEEEEAPCGEDEEVGQECGKVITGGQEAGRVFNVDDADMPARSDVLTVVEGLKCLTQLPEIEWDMLGPFQAASEFVENKVKVLPMFDTLR